MTNGLNEPLLISTDCQEQRCDVREYQKKRGERSEIIYTVIGSCRRRAINPLAYLRDALTRQPSLTSRQIPEVTPKAG